MSNRIKFVQLLLMLLCSGMAYSVTFLDVWEYRVEGNTLLSRAVIQRAVNPYLGQARTIEDVDQAARELQQLYRNEGFATVFVEVPAQDIVDGIVTLKVTEAKVRRVRVIDNKYFTVSGIREMTPSLQEGNPLHIPSLQQDLQAANGINSDLKIVPVLKQGPTPEMIDVDLNVADSVPVTASLEMNNYHTESTTPRRLSAGLGYGNLWQKNHAFSLQYQISPEDKEEVNVISANYTLPVGVEGDRVAIYGFVSDSDIASVSDISVIGDGWTIGVQYIKPLVQKAGELHTLSMGLDYKDFDEQIAIIGSDDLYTPISYGVWSGQYNQYRKLDRWTHTFNAKIALGIRSGINTKEEFDNKTENAEANFFVTQIGLQSEYDIGKDWSFKSHIRTQQTGSTLVSNEQYSIGGVNTVRGYYEAQVQGDRGWVVNLSLEAPTFSARDYWLNKLTPYIFYDYASVRLNSPAPEQEDTFEISGYGFGLRANITEYIDVRLDGGFALEDQSSVQAGDFSGRASVKLEF